MPLYDYVCPQCSREFEVVLPLSLCDKSQKCLKCGTFAKKIIVLGGGGILRTGDSLPWVRSVAKILTDDPDRPNPNLQTVQDLRNYYKSHPNVIPAESHPALPSSLGDAISSKPDEKIVKQKRAKQGNELLRKMRSISINPNAGRAVQVGT